MEENVQKGGRAVIQKQPRRKKDGEKFDGFLISVRNQTASERWDRSEAAALRAVRNLAVTCSLKTRPPLVLG